MKPRDKQLSATDSASLLELLEKRFTANPQRHAHLSWQDVKGRLVSNPGKLWSLFEMERTGGEPDLVVTGHADGSYMFVDCSAESPSGRRSLCYDASALDSRKENKPKGSAGAMASDMGISLLTEAEYMALQQLGNFDQKTSSWLFTPAEIRNRGGAIFGDRRFDRVFIYHNGAESYYAARGFRGCIKL